MMSMNFTDILSSAAQSPGLQAVLIIIATLILEDAATLFTAMEVAAGAVALPVALGALYTGIVVGDLGLYALGRLSASHPWARRLVPTQRRAMGYAWVNARMFPLIVVSRFVPGLRVPTFTTMGFLQAPLQKFLAAAVLATLLWTTGLFFLSLRLGALMLTYLGAWRWAGLAVFLGVIILVGRFATRQFNKRAEKEAEE